MRAPVSAAIAIGVGLVILLGYFIPVPTLQNVRTTLLDWAVILAAVAAWVGAANLILVHVSRVRSQHESAAFSLVVIVAFVLTVLVGVVLTPANAQFQHVVTSIQMPVEASLMAMLAFTLVYAAVRLLRRRANLLSILFIVAAVIFLILDSGLLPFENVPVLVSGLVRLPIAGSRGILLGVALGSLATGIRILLGADRPYSG